MKHKWHKEIKAWADGAKIEYKFADKLWTEVNGFSPSWDEHFEYRIKQQPKSPKYLYVYLNNIGETVFLHGEARGVTWTLMGKIKLESEE